MDPAAALARLDALLDPRPKGLRLERDEEEIVVSLRRDMLHLDADELHDRLHHWTLGALSAALPHAVALVSFRHARPEAPHEEATLDAQERWLDLEPMLRVDARTLSDEDLARFATLVPRFLALVEAEGRPAGFRRHDVGTME